jgi:transcriptional regulator with XRE-family HTH domain
VERLQDNLLERSIGAEVRRRRTLNGLAANELARAAGLSPGMLSRIERGLISPSITSLNSLARALHVPLASLFSSLDDRHGAILTRAGKGVVREVRSQRNVRREMLGISVSGPHFVQPQLVSIASRQRSYAELPTTGVVFIYVIAGRLVYSHGNSAFSIATGDSLLFGAGLPHRIEEVSVFPTHLLVVSCADRPERPTSNEGARRNARINAKTADMLFSLCLFQFALPAGIYELGSFVTM